MYVVYPKSLGIRPRRFILLHFPSQRCPLRLRWIAEPICFGIKPRPDIGSIDRFGFNVKSHKIPCILLQQCPFPYIEAYSTQLHYFASTEQNNSAFRLADYELIRIFAVTCGRNRVERWESHEFKRAFPLSSFEPKSGKFQIMKG